MLSVFGHKPPAGNTSKCPFTWLGRSIGLLKKEPSAPPSKDEYDKLYDRLFGKQTLNDEFEKLCTILNKVIADFASYCNRIDIETIIPRLAEVHDVAYMDFMNDEKLDPPFDEIQRLMKSNSREKDDFVYDENLKRLVSLCSQYPEFCSPKEPYERLLISEPENIDIGSSPLLLSVLRTPIGYHQTQFAQKIHTTSQIIAKMIVDYCKEKESELKKIIEENPELLKHVARAEIEFPDDSYFRDNLTLSKSPHTEEEYLEEIGFFKEVIKTLEDPANTPGPEIFLKMMLEGLTTLNGSLALLTMEEQKDYLSPEKLLEDLIEEDLPKEIGALFYSGLLMPVLNAGHYFKNVFECNNGRLELSPALKARLKKDKTSSKAKRFLRLQTKFAGKGCPIAYATKGSSATAGLKVLSGLFLKVFKLVNKNPGWNASNLKS